MLKFSSVDRAFVFWLESAIISPSNTQHSIRFHCFAQQACSMPGPEGCKSQTTLGLHFSPVRRVMMRVVPKVSGVRRSLHSSNLHCDTNSKSETSNFTVFFKLRPFAWFCARLAGFCVRFAGKIARVFPLHQHISPNRSESMGWLQLGQTHANQGYHRDLFIFS